MSTVSISAGAGRRAPSKRAIGGVTITAMGREEAAERLWRAIAEGEHVKLAFANANLVNFAAADAALAHALRGFLIFPDGVGVDLGSRLLHGSPFPANLNGTDLTPYLLATSPAPLRIMLLGARPGVAERAAAEMARSFPRHQVSALADGYFTPAQEPAILARLEAARPDLLLVAFGNPRQELWIARALDERHCAVAAGVGALFDFVAGEARRAPPALRRMRMEWAWRLAHEPGRLWRRYLLGSPAFLARVVAQKLTRSA